ncbi:EAL domain-containing protein [Marinobacter salinexigens]|uniref:EAL domain-containing protein n=1 Tax=Marinobacter salinexigens TaxID=2919747 RepID=A0A5B0VDH5_9GAMM|nr:EAL domain-containing protein [Marinobacter salinexigens]KAA1172388.1 EAL domain-containing protein [Marinobacter salinexigens]
MKEFVITRCRSDQRQTPARSTWLSIDDEGRILHADHHAESVLGYDANELRGRPVQTVLASRQDDPFAPANRHQLERGQKALVTFRHKEGFFYTANLSLSQESRDSDKAATATITYRSVSDIDPALFQLAESSAEFGIWELDNTRNTMSWSGGLFRILELKPGTEITPEQALYYCQTGQARVRAMFRRCILTGQPFSIELTIVTAKQDLRRVMFNGQRLEFGPDTHRLGGTLVDLTREMTQDNTLQQSERLLAMTTLASRDLIAAVDTQLNLLHCNQAFARHFARHFGTVPAPGQNLKALLSDFPSERRMAERLWQKAFERESLLIEMPAAQGNQELPILEFHYQRLTDSQGQVLGAVHVARDTTARSSRTGRGDHRLRHDPITGLMNRREFLTRLQRILDQKHQRISCDSLLFIDLDHFEGFNQQAGSGTCDRYLRELAGSLGIRVRQRDALARLSGDTFALLIENCPQPRARELANEIITLIGDFVFESQEQTIRTTASGGLLILEGKVPGDPEQLLDQAAELCHTAKTSGRNRIHAAQAIDHPTDEAMTSQQVTQIRSALDNENLLLEYQVLKPVASATWGDHIEILCRIPGKDHLQPPLQPDEFLPVAERFDLARQLDRQVIRQTLAWLHQRPLMEPRLKYCGFNLSLASVLDDTFPEFMLEVLSDSPYDPGCFCLEIREAHATRYPDDVAQLSEAMHKVGCRVALDGAGASVESYSLAARLPVDIIKLDRQMMSTLEEDPVQQVMLEALHRIAEAAGKTTVATFIENDDMLRKVRALGIHFGQGFRLSRPLPLSELAPVAVDLSTGRIGG